METEFVAAELRPRVWLKLTDAHWIAVTDWRAGSTPTSGALRIEANLARYPLATRAILEINRGIFRQSYQVALPYGIAPGQRVIRCDILGPVEA